MDSIGRYTDILTTGPGIAGSLVAYLIISVSLFMIASQDKEDFAWFAFVPFLNLFLMCKIGRVNPLMLLLFFVPCVNLFVYAYLWAKIGETRDKAIWGWLCIVPCFLYVSPIVIALDKK